MTHPDPDIVKRLEELHAKATPAPWGWRECGEKSNDAVLGTWIGHDDTPVGGHVVEATWDELSGEYVQNAEQVDTIAYKENDANYADFALIVELRNALPALLARLKAAEAESAKLTARVGELEEAVRVMGRYIQRQNLGSRHCSYIEFEDDMKILRGCLNANPTASAAIATAEGIQP